MVFMTFAWYTTNSRVTSSVIINVIGGSDYSYTLEYYDDSSSEWVQVTTSNPLSFDKFDPGDAMYLRFVIASSSTENGTIQAKIKSYSSSVSDDLTVDLTTMKILHDGYDVLDIIENEDSTTSTAYPYVVEMEGEVIYYISSDGEITLADDYKIENAMVTYDLATSESDLTPSGLSSLSTLTSQSLDDYIFGSSGETVYASTTSYAYFAIEYVDYESSSTEEQDYDSNNYFIYQSFAISAINVYL